MKKILLLALAAGASFCAYADDTNKTITWPDGTSHEVKPVVTMKVAVDGETERTFNFGSYQNEAYYAIDFGDGELVVTDSIGYTTSTASKAAATGVAKGEGVITVYAENADDIWYFSTSTGMSTTSSIESIDLTSLKKVQQMSIGGAAVETMDLSACDSLRNFTAAKGALTAMDFSNNPELTSLNLTDNKLASLNISKNTKLDQLTIYNNELTALDLTANAAITGLYAYGNKLTSVKFAEGAALKTINLNDNALTEIALPEITGSSSMLYLNDNQLVELTVPTSVGTFEAANNKIAKISLVDCTKSCKIENNCLTIATLPAKPAGLNTASKIKKFTYAPQAPAEVTRALTKNSVLDLSDMLTAVGEFEEGNATTEYTFINAAGDTLKAETDYTVVEAGKFQFTNENTGRIYAAMTNAAFPKATDALAFTTAEVAVVKPLVAMKVTVDGETERIFNFGTYKNSDFYAVDFGDGNAVVTNEIGNKTNTATATAVSGVAKGEGNITIYAENDSVFYFATSTGMSTTSPIESIDLSNLKLVQQMSIGGLAMQTVDVSACDSLRNFTSAKGELTTMDFSNNPELTSLNLTDNKLTSINIAKNAKLDQLTIYNNVLTELDLTANAAITGLYAYSNKLTSVKFAEGAALKTINLQKNNLKEITLPTITGSSSMLYLNDNELTELTVPSSVGTFEAHNNKLAKISLVDCTKSCKLENNCFTIATLPAKPAGLNTASKIKKFTYAPQAPMAVEATVNGKLDLSSQLTAVGELEEGEATTVYAFADAEGNALTEGTDYIVEGGVATFNASFTGIHAIMTSDAFPKATGDNAFVTTAFDVAAAVAIKNVANDAKSGNIYNMNGVKVAAPEKGINISNGKKFYVK